MNEAEYTIRPGRAGDAEHAARLWRQMADQHRAYDAEMWHWRDDAGERFAAQFAGLAESANMVVLVAEAPDDGLLGYAIAEIRKAPAVMAPEFRGFVWDLVVGRRARRGGIGRALMQACFNELKRRGCEDVILHVALGNVAAEKFYEKLGMRPVMQRMYKRL